MISLLDKYIYIKRKAFSKDQCNGIIDFFERSEQEENYRGYVGVYQNLNTSQNLFIKNILTENIENYIKKHKFLKTLYVPWGVSTPFHIQKYLPKNSYAAEHMEHGCHSDDCKRILAWMFYLNDIKRAGGTCWPQQNFISKPRAGDLYIWPAGWTHSHHGISAPNETKYIITGWFELYP